MKEKFVLDLSLGYVCRSLKRTQLDTRTFEKTS